MPIPSLFVHLQLHELIFPHALLCKHFLPSDVPISLPLHALLDIPLDLSQGRTLAFAIHLVFPLSL